MIGSAREVRGGISAMVNVCFAHGLFDRWDARYLATHCDGSRARKALKAAGAWVRFAALAATGRVALLHVHIASGASFWRKLAFVAPARWLRIPYVLHVHAGDFDGFLARSRPITRALLRGLYRNAAAVIALTEAWRDALQAAVPGLRAVVIPNPVEIPAAGAPLDGAPTALFLGVVRAEKGVYELLHAWRGVLRRVPQARLVVAGSGEIERARRLAAQLGIAHAVDFPGWVGAADKARRLHAASLLVLPSHFEALPMAVLEAMAAGVQVVATRVGGIPDAVGPEAALLVAPRDTAALEEALVALLSEGERRAALGAAGRARAAERFSAAVAVPEIERLWARCLPTAKRTIPTRAACP